MDTALNIATLLVEAAAALKGDIEISPVGEVTIEVDAADEDHGHSFLADDPIVESVGRLVGRNRWLEAEVDRLAARARRLESRLAGVRAIVDGAEIRPSGNVHGTMGDAPPGGAPLADAFPNIFAPFN